MSTKSKVKSGCSYAENGGLDYRKDSMSTVEVSRDRPCDAHNLEEGSDRLWRTRAKSVTQAQIAGYDPTLRWLEKAMTTNKAGMEAREWANSPSRPVNYSPIGQGGF
jgi:hypothetical protein